MTKNEKCVIAELCIDIGQGQAIIRKDNEVEFDDCTPISIKSLEFIVKEGKAFINWRNKRRRG